MTIVNRFLIILSLACLAMAIVQQWKYEALDAKYKLFVTQTEQAAQKSENEKKAREDRDKRLKEQADAEAKSTIDGLRADNKRLRDARASRGYIPTTGTGTGSAELACFDRTELESALRQFDAEVSELIGEGAKAITSLDTAKKWAKARSRPEDDK